jgi:branched-chain amino acid transport system permease protein
MPWIESSCSIQTFRSFGSLPSALASSASVVRPDPDTLARAPVEVATFPSETPRLTVVIIALLALVVAYRGNAFALNELAFTFLFAGLATAWNVIGGYGGQFSLANGVFLAIGAYLTANLSIGFGLSPWLSLLPSAACAAAAATLIAWPAFRLRGPFFAIVTMAFNQVAFVLVNYFDTFTGGPRGLVIPFRLGLPNMIFRDRTSYAFLMLGYLIACFVVGIFVARSRLGYYLQAVRDNDQPRAPLALAFCERSSPAWASAPR